MSDRPLPSSKDLMPDASALGIYALGVARAKTVDTEGVARYERWIADGCHASMDYLEKYADARSDPRLLLDGARSIIVAAFNYHHLPVQSPGSARIAEYAHGDDYHLVVRQRLEALAGIISERYGGTTRVCVDTAPLRERYWAVEAGVGFIGRNSQLIIPNAGSRFFLGTILTTAEFAADSPSTERCVGCDRCVNACPGGAIIAGRNAVDARRCLSFLTIESREDLPEGVDLRGNLYGCDICQNVCPHNEDSPLSTITEFSLRAPLADLTAAEVEQMTQEEFSAMFRRSAIKRAKLAGLRRNASRLG